MLIDVKMSLIQKIVYFNWQKKYILHGNKYIISTQKGESTDLTPTTYKSMARNLFCISVRNTCDMDRKQAAKLPISFGSRKYW